MNDEEWLSAWGWWRRGEKSFEGIFSARENFFPLREGYGLGARRRVAIKAKNLPFGEAGARGRARTGTSLKDTGF